MKELLHSITVQRRVIGALLMREIITRYGRNNIGFLWLFVEPALYTIVITLIWHYTRAGRITSLPITAMAVTGYISIQLWRNIVGRVKNAVSVNNAILFHRNIKVLDVFISRTLLEVFGAFFSFVVVSTIFINVGWMGYPEDTLKIILAFLILSWFGASLALNLGSLISRFPIFDRIWKPISYALFILSGLFFIVDWLPPDGRHIVLLFPMAHGLELLRDGYFGSMFTAHYDIGYAAICCLGMTLSGLLLLNLTGRGWDAE
ncbi:MAG: ABC transporter permease [Chlorobiaceae bacterium]|nr:ABC transporter permease [Chlorobiaceae bacterium]